MLVCLHFVCFHTAAVELSTCDRDCMVCRAKNIYCLAHYRKSLQLLSISISPCVLFFSVSVSLCVCSCSHRSVLMCVHLGAYLWSTLLTLHFPPSPLFSSFLCLSLGFSVSVSLFDLSFSLSLLPSLSVPHPLQCSLWQVQCTRGSFRLCVGCVYVCLGTSIHTQHLIILLQCSSLGGENTGGWSMDT